MIAREQGAEKAKDASENVIYKIEVPANRCALVIFVFYSIVLVPVGTTCCVPKDSLLVYWSSSTSGCVLFVVHVSLFKNRRKAPRYEAVRSENGPLQKLIIKPEASRHTYPQQTSDCGY